MRFTYDWEAEVRQRPFAVLAEPVRSLQSGIGCTRRCSCTCIQLKYEEKDPIHSFMKFGPSTHQTDNLFSFYIFYVQLAAANEILCCCFGVAFIQAVVGEV